MRPGHACIVARRTAMRSDQSNPALHTSCLARPFRNTRRSAMAAPIKASPLRRRSDPCFLPRRRSLAARARQKSHALASRYTRIPLGRHLNRTHTCTHTTMDIRLSSSPEAVDCLTRRAICFVSCSRRTLLPDPQPSTSDIVCAHTCNSCEHAHLICYLYPTLCHSHCTCNRRWPIGTTDKQAVLT